MKKLFGHDDNKGAAPLYKYEIELDSEVRSMIGFFYDLKHVDKEQHYNKCIDICIGGKWEGDNIGYGFGIGAKLEYDTKTIVLIIAKRTDKEIKSVFYFIYDGPHPEPWGKYEEATYQKISHINSKVAELMKQAYEELLAADDGHGH